MQKYFSLLALLVLIISMAAPAFADGMAHIKRPDGWAVQPEKEQYAAINYENGYQNMILTVGFDDLQDGTAVWIFPVPAKPEDTVIGIIEDFPSYAGTDVKQRASSAVGGTFTTMRFTQPYTWPFLLLAASVMSTGGVSSGASDLTTYYSRTVTVYERIQKDGVTTELVTAKNPDSLYSYLSLKGAELPQASKAVLGDYIGKDYSFVISWVSDMAAYAASTQNEAQPYDYYYYGGEPAPKAVIGVSITFPTDRIYFPLKPTSVYESAEVPATLYISSHVTPVTYPEIANSITTQYFTQSTMSISKPALQKFFNGKSYLLEFDYTKVTLKVPSKYLKEDLWFSPSPPASVSAQSFAAKQSFAWGWTVLILLSGISGLVAGMVVYRKDKPSAPKFFLLGLLNCLTLVALIIATVVGSIGKRLAGSKDAPKKEVPASKILITMLIASLILTALFMSPFLLMLIPSLGYMGSSPYMLQSFVFGIVMIFVIAFPFAFFICAPVVFGYFRSPKALYFIILFSVLFMVLSFVAELVFRAAIGV